MACVHWNDKDTRCEVTDMEYCADCMNYEAVALVETEKGADNEAG